MAGPFELERQLGLRKAILVLMNHNLQFSQPTLDTKLISLIIRAAEIIFLSLCKPVWKGFLEVT